MHKPDDIGFDRHVGGDGLSASAGVADALHRGLEPLRTSRAEHHRDAFARQRFSAREPDARRGARDDRNAARQCHSHRR